MERIHLFDITPPALIPVVTGVGYILTVGRRLMPDREASAELLETYELHEYLTALVVKEESPMAGQSLAASEFGKRHGLEVLRIDRGNAVIKEPTEDTVIEAGDLLLVEGSIPHIAEIRRKHGVEVSSAREEAGAVAAQTAESAGTAEDAEAARRGGGPRPGAR